MLCIPCNHEAVRLNLKDVKEDGIHVYVCTQCGSVYRRFRPRGEP